MGWLHIPEIPHPCPLPGHGVTPWPDEFRRVGTRWQRDDCGDVWEAKKEKLEGIRILVRWSWDRLGQVAT